MRRTNIKVFDDYIPSTAAVYTKEELNPVLGKYDYLALQAIVDNIPSGTSGTLLVQLFHSSDGRIWVAKNGYSTGAVGGNALAADLSVTLASSGGIGWAAASTVLPSLQHVRFKISFSGGTITAGHVRIWVTARDRAHRKHHGHGTAMRIPLGKVL